MKYTDYYRHLINEVLRGESDDYYYHITLAPYVDNILTNGLQIGKKATVSNYREHSRGKIFLCDIGVVDWWKFNIEQHAFHQHDDERFHNVAVLKIKKDKLSNVYVDEIGSEDSRGQCYYVTSNIPANVIEVHENSVPDNNLNESLDDPYKYSGTFSYETIDVEDEEIGATYKKDVFTPTQIIKFKTEDGVEYIWYAQQSRHNENFWTIAFGTYQGQDDRGTHKLDINLTKNTKNPFRVFATVIAIINGFIELDEDQTVHYLQFDSEGDKRTQLYLNRLLPRIEHFVVDYIETHKTMNNTNKSTVTLKRVS
jgi:hypothetical protein